jgi:hypothetical protein
MEQDCKAFLYKESKPFGRISVLISDIPNIQLSDLLGNPWAISCNDANLHLDFSVTLLIPI